MNTNVQRAIWGFVFALGLLVPVTATADGHDQRRYGGDEINAVLGDASWVAKFGTRPDATATEQKRIQVHLAFVLDRLRETDVNHLGPAQKRNRRRALESLRQYIDRGVFPRRGQDSYSGRRPRFIDSVGTYCAVGYLLAESGATELAESINADFEYAYVPQITSPGLLAWASEFGFSLDELAMIQPGYSALPTEASTRHALHDANAGITLKCARSHPRAERVRIKVEGDDSGQATVSSSAQDAFTRCYVELANKLETGGGAYEGSPEPYRFTMTLTTPSPQALLEERFRRTHFGGNNTGCLPAPRSNPQLGDFRSCQQRAWSARESHDFSVQQRSRRLLGAVSAKAVA